jgi:hypothetical protein
MHIQYSTGIGMYRTYSAQTKLEMEENSAYFKHWGQKTKLPLQISLRFTCSFSALRQRTGMDGFLIVQHTAAGIQR